MKITFDLQILSKYFLGRILVQIIKMLYYDRTDVSEGIMLIIQVHQKSMIFATIGVS